MGIHVNILIEIDGNGTTDTFQLVVKQVIVSYNQERVEITGFSELSAGVLIDLILNAYEVGDG